MRSGFRTLARTHASILGEAKPVDLQVRKRLASIMTGPDRKMEDILNK